MEKTAREMFEELGYEYSYGDDNYLSYFINKPNEKGANLEYTLDNKELLKGIYRSVF